MIELDHDSDPPNLPNLHERLPVKPKTESMAPARLGAGTGDQSRTGGASTDWIYQAKKKKEKWT